MSLFPQIQWTLSGRLCRRAKLARENLSGSFQFSGSGGEDKQILYGSDQTTCPSLGPEPEEPQYAEIAEIQPGPSGSLAPVPADAAYSPRHLGSTLPIRSVLQNNVSKHIDINLEIPIIIKDWTLEAQFLKD